MSVANLNDVIFEKIIKIEQYNSRDYSLMWMATQLEDATLDVTSEERVVNDALGSPIAKFFRGRSATLSVTNALFNLPVAAAQSGNSAGLVRGTAEKKIQVPMSETITTSGTTITLAEKPLGTPGAEIPFIYAMDGTGYWTRKYSLGSIVSENEFTLDATSKTITLPTGTPNGTRIMVNYTGEKQDALQFTATGNDSPRAGIAHLWVKCHNICDVSSVVYGVLVCENAQLDGNYQLNFTPEGKHSIQMQLMQNYCDPDKLLYKFFMY